MSLTKARPKQVNIRLSPREHEEIVDKADAVGLTKSEFVRLAALGRSVPRRDRESKRIIAEISRIGGLLNQLARAANRGRPPDSKSIESAIGELRDVIRAIGTS